MTRPAPTPKRVIPLQLAAWALLAITLIAGSFSADTCFQDLVLNSNQGHWSTSRAAAFLSHFGDWPELMAAGGIGVFVARRLRNVRWQRILLSAMIASTLAGMTVNASRLTTGRTRPRATAEQGWYGPRHDGKWLIGMADFNSFPSGHTATAVGFAGVILFAAPAWGITAIVVAGSIALSRILLGAHHPSDVVTATFIALAVAWLVWGFLGRNGRVDRYMSDPCARRSPVQE